jgi:maltokinase
MTMAPAAGASAALARRLAPELVAAKAAERPITVDQTNLSVVVGQAVVVKWLRVPTPPPHRGAQLLGHLAAVGFSEVPTLLGVEEIAGRIVAIVTSYVPDSQDGWQWYVDDVTSDIDAGDAAPSVATARRLGSIAGRLHAALATPSAVIREPVRHREVAGEAARGARLLDEARRLATGAAGEAQEILASSIAADLAVLDHADDVPVQPVHGDLHVGQMLRSGDDIVVIDFDGDPVSTPPGGFDPADGVERRSAMVDLAALVQSVDHVARVVAKYRPDLAAPLDEFVRAATAEVVDAYGEISPVDARLLRPLRVIQELHEFVYAATMLPSWSYVPGSALAALYR